MMTGQVVGEDQTVLHPLVVAHHLTVVAVAHHLTVVAVAHHLTVVAVAHQPLVAAHHPLGAGTGNLLKISETT
jgi:hypothetical protein